MRLYHINGPLSSLSHILGGKIPECGPIKQEDGGFLSQQYQGYAEFLADWEERQLSSPLSMPPQEHGSPPTGQAESQTSHLPAKASISTCHILT